VAVLNRTTNALTTVAGDQQTTTPLPLAGPGSLAPRTDGAAVPVTVSDERQVYVVRDGTVRGDFRVPGDGAKVQPAVAWEGFFYIADDATGVVHVFDAAGRPQRSIEFANAGGPLELEVRESYLFINAPGSSTARVVDDAHVVRVVDKYADDVLGGDKPPTPPTPPPPPKPRKPVVSKPGRRGTCAPPPATPRPGHLAGRERQRRGDQPVRRGRRGPHDHGRRQPAARGRDRPDQRRDVHVRGARGQRQGRRPPGAAIRSGRPPRCPTRRRPRPPTAKPDGTVVVSWPAANGQGLDIRRYAVTAISDGSSAPVGDATGTSLTVRAGSWSTASSTRSRGGRQRAGRRVQAVADQQQRRAVRQAGPARSGGRRDGRRPGRRDPVSWRRRPTTAGRSPVVVSRRRQVDRRHRRHAVTLTGFGTARRGGRGARGQRGRRGDAGTATAGRSTADR
jgi:hypothetical protein